MPQRYRVFISSNSELRQDRREVLRAVRACGCEPVAMEDWNCSEKDLLRKIVDEVRQSDYLVLLVGDRPSSVCPSTKRGTPKKSYVQIEYEAAKKAGISVITLLKNERKLKRKPDNRPSQSRQSGADEWAEFKETLRSKLVTKTYSEISEAGAIVRSSLLSLIRPREQAAVLQTNADLTAEIANYLNECARRKKRVEQAILIQYSAQNARDILRKLYWEGIRTKLYLANHKTTTEGNKFWFSEHQSRCIQDTLENLRNYIEPLAEPVRVSERSVRQMRLEVFQYTAPGSLRVVKLGKEFLAIGAYAYMVKKPKTVRSLDIRGGELPMILFRKEHSGFDLVNKMVDSTVRNWTRTGIAKAVYVFRPRRRRAPRGSSKVAPGRGARVVADRAPSGPIASAQTVGD